MKDAAALCKVLNRGITLDTLMDSTFLGEPWWTCDVSVEGLAPLGGCIKENLRVCSRVSLELTCISFFLSKLTKGLFLQCKSVRYCCEAHQKLAWPTHHLNCFAPKW